MNVLSVVFGPLVDLVKSYVESKAERKHRQQEIEATLQNKKLEQIATAQDYNQAFRIAQVQTAGWRPGYLTILITTPVAMCFVPGLAPYVAQGFQALDQNTPEWFQWMLGIVVTSAFGYQVADSAYEWYKAP